MLADELGEDAVATSLPGLLHLPLLVCAAAAARWVEAATPPLPVRVDDGDSRVPGPPLPGRAAAAGRRALSELAVEIMTPGAALCWCVCSPPRPSPLARPSDPRASSRVHAFAHV